MTAHLGKSDLIAGWNTVADWHALRVRLLANEAGAWREAFQEFFLARLRPRYLLPIEVLQKNGTYSGEGFSIVAIQCTLIEFLESTAQGINYRFAKPGTKLGPYEYSGSQRVFVCFLKDRQPFAKTFDESTAKDFYVGVRCGLLHEARTKQGWRVWADNQSGLVADVRKRIVFRNAFQTALDEYIQQYGAQLETDPALQRAFIRKFDDLVI